MPSKMRLGQLIKYLDKYQVYSLPDDFEVKGISCNSKNIRDDFAFVAIRGVGDDGHRFIQEAIDKGAKAIFIDARNKLAGLEELIERHKEKFAFIVVDDTRKAVGRLAAEFYGNPGRKIKVIGITGTN
jgi:UDP-N-acetylmuramoyl-L-alanyl-D-glutamate--2,6-diaminopimelate ligase